MSQYFKLIYYCNIINIRIQSNYTKFYNLLNKLLSKILKGYTKLEIRIPKGIPVAIIKNGIHINDINYKLIKWSKKTINSFIYYSGKGIIEINKNKDFFYINLTEG